MKHYIEILNQTTLQSSLNIIMTLYCFSDVRECYTQVINCSSGLACSVVLFVPTSSTARFNISCSYLICSGILTSMYVGLHVHSYFCPFLSKSEMCKRQILVIILNTKFRGTSSMWEHSCSMLTDMAKLIACKTDTIIHRKRIYMLESQPHINICQEKDTINILNKQ